MMPRLCVIGCIAPLLLLFGCSQKQAESKYRFIEDVFVQGECSEDHTIVSGNYEGDIVHWYNIATKAHSRYGFVSNTDPDWTRQRVENPNRYAPPQIISFSNLSEKDIADSEFTLHGISDEESNGYFSTCKLTVTKRQDHLPQQRNDESGARPMTGVRSGVPDRRDS
jgi:hypothetical protein